MHLPLILISLFSLWLLTDGLIVRKQVPYTTAEPSSNIHPPKSDFIHGYNIKATPEACKEAARVLQRDIADDLKPEQIGDCKSHIVKYPFKPGQWIKVSHRRRYLSMCPAEPPFHLKNVGSDQWSIYFQSASGGEASNSGPPSDKGLQTVTPDKGEFSKAEPSKAES